jgi:hypothetical protein
MSDPINDLLTSAKILVEAGGERMLSYLIENGSPRSVGG